MCSVQMAVVCVSVCVCVEACVDGFVFACVSVRECECIYKLHIMEKKNRHRTGEGCINCRTYVYTVYVCMLICMYVYVYTYTPWFFREGYSLSQPVDLNAHVQTYTHMWTRFTSSQGMIQLCTLSHTHFDTTHTHVHTHTYSYM